MPRGRLIRVSAFRKAADALGFIVAEPDGETAKALVQSHTAVPPEYVEDLGPVSEALIKALDISPGDLLRTQR
jgi:hypothetical protein